MQGWIKLHRQIRDHWLYKEKPYSKFQAWIDLLLSANHETKKVVLGNELIEVERGSFITSKRKLIDKWGWSNTKVDNFMNILLSDGMIEYKSDTKKTLVSIVNYEDYQNQNDTETTPKRHENTCKNDTKHLQKRTNKNDKNDKNEKNNNIKPFSPKQVYDEDSVHYQLANRLYQKILENNPEHKKPNLQKWANDVRLMMERDKRTEEQIAYLIDWVQADSFWKTVVLSISKLREKYDQLVIRIKEEQRIKQPQLSKSHQSMKDWLEEGEDEQTRDRPIDIDSYS